MICYDIVLGANVHHLNLRSTQIYIPSYTTNMYQSSEESSPKGLHSFYFFVMAAATLARENLSGLSLKIQNVIFVVAAELFP